MKITEDAHAESFSMLMGYRFAFGAFLVPGLLSYRGPINSIYGKGVPLDHTYKDVPPTISQLSGRLRTDIANTQFSPHT